MQLMSTDTKNQWFQVPINYNLPENYDFYFRSKIKDITVIGSRCIISNPVCWIYSVTKIGALWKT